MAASLFVFALLLRKSLCYYPVPVVEINLDSPANIRWNDAIDAILTRHTFNDTFGAVFAQGNKSLFHKIPESDYSIYTAAIQQNYPENYAELEGISSYFATKYNEVVTVQYLSLWVYFHELDHMSSSQTQTYKDRSCTGVVIMDTDGYIFHGRNMDQSFSQGRNLTLSMSFIKNGNQLFRALDWYWFTTGIVTAMKNQTLSIQENWFMYSQSYESIKNMVSSGRMPQVFLFRELLSNNEVTFESTVQSVMNIALISPMYVIIGGISGVHDGVIITKFSDMNDEWNVMVDFANISNISTGNYNNYNPAYYMVQTNYELWKADPKNDDRRTMAEMMLSSWNRDIDSQLLAIGSNLQAIMSSYQVHNSHTLYTGIFSAKYDLFLGYIREPIQPVSY